MDAMMDAEERESLRRFWEALEASRPEVDAAIARAAAETPSLAAMLARSTPEQRAAGREHERAALLEGAWEPFLADLRGLGAAYARSGVAFSEWTQLSGSYREALRRRVLPGLDPAAAATLRGMDRFTDLGIAAIGTAYLEVKEALVRDAEAHAARLVDLFHHAPVGLVIWHLDEPGDAGSFRLVTANASAARFGGTPLTESLGRQLRDLPESSRPRNPGMWLATLADGEARGWSSERGDDPATRRSFEARCFALPGDYIGVLFEDVSERRQLAAQVDRHLREVERSNRELDDFAYVASHDLKSPLRDVRNLVSWITEDALDALPPASAQHLRLVDDRVQRMERLLDDLLEYSRVGRVAEEARAFTLREAFDEAVALAGARPGFAVAMEGDDVALQTPRTPLDKVLRNLLGNALKHHDRADGRVTVRAAVAGDRVEVRVADDGPGIRAEFHERVFRMFQTLRPRDEVEGSGVGLAIVKKTVEHFGGRAWVESDGRGTAVAFTWPLRWHAPGG